MTQSSSSFSFFTVRRDASRTHWFRLVPSGTNLSSCYELDWSCCLLSVCLDYSLHFGTVYRSEWCRLTSAVRWSCARCAAAAAAETAIVGRALEYALTSTCQSRRCEDLVCCGPAVGGCTCPVVIISSFLPVTLLPCLKSWSTCYLTTAANSSISIPRTRHSKTPQHNTHPWGITNSQVDSIQKNQAVTPK